MIEAEPDAPMLQSERLELWRPSMDDLRPLFAIINEPSTRRYLGAVSMEDHFMRFFRNAGSWQLCGHGGFVLRRRGGDGAAIGTCGIFHSWRGLGEDFDDRSEAGWIIGKDYLRQGYASEAMATVFDWFDAVFGKEVVAMIAPGNTASIRMAERFGFAAMRDARLPDGEDVRLFRRPPPSQ